MLKRDWQDGWGAHGDWVVCTLGFLPRQDRPRDQHEFFSLKDSGFLKTGNHSHPAFAAQAARIVRSERFCSRTHGFPWSGHVRTVNGHMVVEVTVAAG